MNAIIGFYDMYQFFSRYKDEFITELEITQKDSKTIDSYQYIIDNFLAFVDEKKVLMSFDQLNHRIIVEFIRFSENKSKKEFTYWTNMAYKKVIKLYINFIEEEREQILKIKWDKIQFKREQSEVKSLDDDSLEKIKKYLGNLYRRYSMIKDKSHLPDELKSEDYIYTVNLAFKLGIYGGLRAEEICKLTLNSITKSYLDSKTQIIEIKVQGKGYKERIIPILYAHIKRELEYFRLHRNENEPLLRQIRGRPLTRHSLYNYLEEVSKYANTKTRGVHILRHTCAMNMRENGVDLADAQDFLGHSDPSITRIYFQKSQNRMRRVASSFR
jgi:integrase/recombinase XerD